jgi:uncharacterized membrane protein
MGSKAVITVHRSPEELERLWESSEYRPEYTQGTDAAVTFTEAPGDRGTEIHVELERGKPGDAKVKDDLRRFKQHVETGEITRSEGAPQGELAERKLKQRPAQPLDESELEKAGV